MGENKSGMLFDVIAPVYGLFYNRQRKWYLDIVEKIRNEMDITSFRTVIDVGCGTGALCSVLSDRGLDVTGIDPAVKMLETAKKKPTNAGIEFIEANVLEGLPFEDKAFDIAISSYVAHGLEKEERKKMYAEMGRVAREYVIIHDYNRERSFFTSIIEWLEGGDYFHFIKHAESEMKDCFSEMEACKTLGTVLFVLFQEK